MRRGFLGLEILVREKHQMFKEIRNYSTTFLVIPSSTNLGADVDSDVDSEYDYMLSMIKVTYVAFAPYQGYT